MSSINFDALTEVQTVNKGRSQDFRIKWNRNAHKFTISNQLWDELNLEMNSLTQVNDTQSGAVYLMEMPRNEGRLLKRLPGKQKGKTFKSDTLHDSLEREGNIEGNKLDLLDAGINPANNRRYWRVIMDGAEMPTEEEPNEEYIAENSEEAILENSEESF